MIKDFDRIDWKKKTCIFADVDDTTCYSCKDITRAMANAVESLIENKLIIAFISSSKESDLRLMVSRYLNGKHYILGTSGTVCTRVE